MQCSLCYIEFRTNVFLEDSFTSSHAIQYFDINPNGKEWDYTLIACFLNNLQNFTKDTNHPFITGVKGKDYHTKFRFRSTTYPESYLDISLGIEISVRGNNDFLNHYFTPHESFYHSFLGGWNKMRKKPKYQKHIYFNFYISNPNDGTRYLFLHKPLIFCIIQDFSQIFKYFCKKVQMIGLSISDDTYSIREFISIHLPPKRERLINSFELLKSNLSGFLTLYIQKSPIKKRLSKISYKDEMFYVTGGIFILPFSKSILSENDSIINGLLLDTTWKLLPYYVTSILMATSNNSGIPLSFSFGFSENKILYNNHFTSFQKFCNINLTQYKFESDQGPALKGIFEEKKIIHCFCFRHIMVNLKLNSISFALNTILKCTTNFEINNAFNHYSKIFSTITDPKLLKLRDQLLKKVGLSFIDGEFYITNFTKWQKVALIERVKLIMPSTTNSLESCHGQLNQKTKRRKNFWTSIYEISKNLIQKVHNFQQQINHNFNYIKNKTFKHLNAISVGNRIQDEISFYQTTSESCLCSENKLISANLHMDIPCCHRLHLGCPFPDCPKIDLNLSSQTSELVVNYIILPSENEESKITIEKQDKHFAIEMIKRFGHLKEENRPEIEKYVDEHYNIQEGQIFINGLPSSILTLIHNGITYFHQIA